jgi:O-antigen ligase
MAEGLRMLGKYADLAFIPLFAMLFRDPTMRKNAGALFAAAVLVTLALSYLMRTGVMPNGQLFVSNSDQPEVFKKYLTQSILMAVGAYYFALLACHTQSGRARFVWAILSVLAVINVAFMLSGRSGQIMLFALVVYGCYILWHWRGLAWICSAMSMVIVLALSGVAGTGSIPQQDSGVRDGSIAAVIRDFQSWHAGQSLRTSTAQRLDYAVNSLAIVREHPLVGVGTGGFAAAYAKQVQGTNLEATVNPHNEYLNIAVQTGIPGMLAVVVLFFLVWRHARALPTALERDLARGLAVAFGIGCLFNSLLMDHVEGLFFAWSVGVLFGGYDPAKMNAAKTI